VGLTKRYGSFTAVDGLTIDVPRGGVVGFVGPNGAGKTTTIRMLLGLIRPSAGTGSVLGHSVTRPRDYLGRVGAIIEAPAFYPQLSGRRNLEVLATLGGTGADRIDALLQQVGLKEWAGKPFKSYSLGMKQRLGIAAALLPDPDLLVLDEPTNGLDPSGIREIRGLLRSLGDAGKTVFVSSHLLAEIQRVCDHIIILSKGRLLYQGTVEGLLASQHGLVVAAQDPRRGAQLVRLATAAGYRCEPLGDSLLVHAPADQAGPFNTRAMQAGIVLRELRVRELDLEDKVIGMTGPGAP